MEGPESLNPFRVEEIGGGIVLRASQNPVRFGDVQLEQPLPRLSALVPAKAHDELCRRERDSDHRGHERDAPDSLGRDEIVAMMENLCRAMEREDSDRPA